MPAFLRIFHDYTSLVTLVQWLLYSGMFNQGKEEVKWRVTESETLFKDFTSSLRPSYSHGFTARLTTAGT